MEFFPSFQFTVFPTQFSGPSSLSSRGPPGWENLLGPGAIEPAEPVVATPLLSDELPTRWICNQLKALSDGEEKVWICDQLHKLPLEHAITWFYYQLNMLPAEFATGWVCDQLNFLSAELATSWICYRLNLRSVELQSDEVPIVWRGGVAFSRRPEKGTNQRSTICT